MMKLNRKKAILLLINAVALCALLFTLYSAGFRVNLTKSLPNIFWIITPLNEEAKIEKGDFVVIDASKIEVAKGFDKKLREKYFYDGLLMLKQVARVPGEIDSDIPIVICEIGMIEMFREGRRERVLSYDSSGIPLPNYPVPAELREQEYWVTSDEEIGFDSRYFGPVNRSAITAKAVPVF